MWRWARRLLGPSRFAVSISTFVGTFRLLEVLGEKYAKTGRDKRNVSSAAGAIASLVALIFLDAKRKSMIISFATIEALMQLVHTNTSLVRIRHIDAPLAVFIFYRTIYVWVFQHHFYTKIQCAHLDGLSQLSHDTLHNMRKLLAHHDPLISNTTSRCELFHPHQTCMTFHRGFFKRLFLSSLKLYFPIYFISQVVTKYKHWLRPSNQRLNFVKLLTQYFRSALCLTMMYVIPLSFSCWAPLKSHRWNISVGGALTVLSLWFEHEKRRTTLLKAIAVYPLSATATQIAQYFTLSDRMKQAIQALCFSTCVAILFQHPELRNQTAMKMLYGSPHYPSKEKEGNRSASIKTSLDS